MSFPEFATLPDRASPRGQHDTRVGNVWGGPQAFPASLELLHRLGEISEIADATVAARHAVHLDAHLLDALHQRGCAG
jgi:hypothetical protein